MSDVTFTIDGEMSIGQLRLALHLNEGTTAIAMNEIDWLEMGCPSVVKVGHQAADVLPSSSHPRGEITALAEDPPEDWRPPRTLLGRILHRLGIID